MKLSGYIERCTETTLLIYCENDPAEVKKTDSALREHVRDTAGGFGRRISDVQRKKIYATINDIANYSGEFGLFGRNSIKGFLKSEFITLTEEEKGHGWFSLSDCSMELAYDFTNYLIEFCLENDIPTKEPLINRYADIDQYMYLCLKYKKCARCNDPGEEHHIDAIGMGHDRRKKDDSDHRKICLCRKHHTKAHTIGWTEFAKKYHVKGILFNE